MTDTKQYANKLADQIEATFAGHADVAAEIAEFIRRDAQTLRDETVSGWSNYATFTVASCLDNMRQAQDDLREILSSEKITNNEWPTLAKADALKEYVETWVDPYPSGGSDPQILASALKTVGLSEVNWREIAEAWEQD